MKRTQIQFPDKLFERLKAQAAGEESTFAELMRKAGEYYLSVHPEHPVKNCAWKPPKPLDLGAFIAAEVDWRELANAEETRP
jgi:hypothetical protein